MKTLQTRITPEFFDHLTTFASDRGESTGSLVRRVLMEHSKFGAFAQTKATPVSTKPSPRKKIYTATDGTTYYEGDTIPPHHNKEYQIALGAGTSTFIASDNPIEAAQDILSGITFDD